MTTVINLAERFVGREHRAQIEATMATWRHCAHKSCSMEEVAATSIEGVLEVLDHRIASFAECTDTFNGMERFDRAAHAEACLAVHTAARGSLAAVMDRLTPKDREVLVGRFNSDFNAFNKRLNSTKLRVDLGLQ